MRTQARLLGFDAKKLEETLSKEGYVFLDMLYEDSKGDDLESRREHYYHVLRNLKPGVTETAIEAEYAHEFIRRGGRFAYWPIIASGKNACAGSCDTFVAIECSR